MTRFLVFRLAYGRMACAVAAAMMLCVGVLGCAGSQSDGYETGKAVSVFSEPDASIGDVKVWLVQNAGLAKGYRESRSSSGVDIVMVNESHSQYRNISSDQLSDSERIIPDVVAKRMLSDLVAAGMTSSKSGAIGLSVPPDQYARGVTRRIHMWIGVEHRLTDGRTSYTFLPQYVLSLEELKANEETVKLFNRCHQVVLAATWNSMPKDRSKGTMDSPNPNGIDADDLRGSGAGAPKKSNR